MPAMTLRHGAVTSILLPLLAACAASGGATSEQVTRAGAGRTAESPPYAAPASVSPLASAGDTLWLLAPDPAADAVHVSDTEDSLIARYGAANVSRGYVDQGEGMLVNGTIIFPGDSLRQLEIQWDDTISRRHPVQVYAIGSGWTIAPGIRLGTTLQELERMNGGPFELSGFRGHYPGHLRDWRSGRLAWLADVHDDRGRRAMLLLQPEPPYPDGVDLDRYDSEERFLSSEAGMQRLQPRVVYLAVRPRE